MFQEAQYRDFENVWATKLMAMPACRGCEVQPVRGIAFGRTECAFSRQESTPPLASCSLEPRV